MTDQFGQVAEFNTLRTFLSAVTRARDHGKDGSRLRTAVDPQQPSGGCCPTSAFLTSVTLHDAVQGSDRQTLPFSVQD